MKISNNWVFIAYYIYAVLVVFASGYVVFILNNNGCWFIVTAILLQIKPYFKTKK